MVEVEVLKKIIAISGKARSGKDTFAKYLEEIFKDEGYSVLITHYADLLKYVCKEFLNWNGEKDEEGRKLLQYVGTDVIRAKNPDYWVNFIIDILDFFPDKWDYVIIPDVRFPNELSQLKKRGYDVYHIHVDRHLPIKNYATYLHSSETAMDNEPYDCEVMNNKKVNLHAAACVVALEIL